MNGGGHLESVQGCDYTLGMHANPGGIVDPKDVIGRAPLIASIWRALERQSVILTAERRLGKTSILRKMEAEPRPGWIAKYRDLEGVQTPADFVALVHQDIAAHLQPARRATHRFMATLKQLSGAEIGGLLKLPPQAESYWKTLLSRLIEDLCEEQTEHRLVFFWDEVPLMLYNCAKKQGEQTAMELLDTLRSLRQSHPALRMVFTGSIGLHNVLATLKRAGYANAPTNDMRTLDVPGLGDEDAVHLATALLEGEHLQTRDRESTAAAIAQHVSNLPFLIHSVVSGLVEKGLTEVGPEQVAALVKRSLTDPQDPWHLGYYHERIRTYYSDAERALTWPTLDVLAMAAEPLSLAALQAQVVATAGPVDPEALRAVLVLVQRDHYLTQDEDGRYRFRFSIIQRHWQYYRGLRG